MTFAVDLEALRKQVLSNFFPTSLLLFRCPSSPHSLVYG